MKTATENPHSINYLGQLLGVIVVSVIAILPATAQPVSGNTASGSPVAVKPGPAKPIVTSVDHRVTVTYSAFQFDARKRVYTTRVRIKNRSGAPLLSPLRLGFNQADLGSVRLLNAHGTGIDGRPYFEFALPKKLLAAGATTQSIPIVFSIEKSRDPNPKGKSPANATKANPSVFVLAQRVSAGAEWALLTPTADPYALPANSGKVTVRFSVRLAGKTKSSSAVYLRRSGDKQSVAMNDLGKDGDVTARDGILGVKVQIDTGKVRPDTCLRYEAFTRQGRVELISPPLRLCVSSFPVRIAESNTASSATWPDGSKAVADEILLSVAPATGTAAVRQLAATINARVVGSILPLNFYQLKLPAPVNADQLLEISAKLGKRTGVLSASVNAIGGYAFTPNDPEFPTQHGLQRIRAHDVWDAGANGNGVTAVVLDSGIDRTHPDFGVVGACQLADNDCGSPSTDTLGHGTQVAGVFAARTNNALGVAGVAFGSKIKSIQVSATATITAAQIVAGFTAARAYGLASVINSSISVFNAFQNWDAVCQSIDLAVVNAGVPIAVTVNAAGNNNLNGNAAPNGTFYPSRCNDVNPMLTRKDLFITVANSTSVVTAACGNVALDNRCANSIPAQPTPDGSNYGSWVDIAAPGSEIRTTALGGTYASPTGTSFSAPMVSGAAAILKSCGVPLDQIESTLRTGTHPNALPIVTVPFPDASSAPRLDIHRALLSRNRVPTGVSLAPNSLNENINTSAGVEVGTLAAVDLDTCDKFTYTKVGGTDAALFSIGGANNDRLILTAGVLDFETKPSYAVTVRVTDFAGATFDQSLTVNVININEAPTGVVLLNTVTSTPENGPAIKVADIAIIDDALGTNVLSLSGPDAASFSIVGAELRFNGGANFEVKNSYSVTVNVDDATVGATPDASQNFTLAITNVNEAPTATNLSAPETYTEDVALNLTDIVVSDVDSATVTATLTLSNPAAGSLSTATSGAVTSTYVAGTGVWTASGALADVNVLLAGVVFTPAPSFNGNFTIATSVSDGVAAPITGSKAMTGTAVNDAPTATNLSAPETYTEDVALNLTNIVVSDADSATVTATLTLSNPLAGSLSTATSGAVTSTYVAGTGVWTASGALADVNVLLAGVTFNPAPNFNGNFTIATSVSDGVAAPITGSKAMTGTAVNDAPTGLPTISGTLTVGQTLTAVTSAIADADGPMVPSFSYQWMRGVTDIPGQTGILYVLIPADFGTVVNVRVSYTDDGGTFESLTTVNATNTGDPHITTVDGLHYDFQAAGEFVTLRGANGMEIQTRQTPVSTAAAIADSHSGLSVGVSINTAVAARVGMHRVTLQPNISGLAAASGLELRVDGVLRTLPANGINLGSGARVAPLPGGAIQVDFPDGTTMIVTPGFWTPHNVWYLNVGVFHTSAREGIMGARYQGSWLPRLADGTSLGARPAALHDRYVELYEKFANSWRVKKETSLFDYAQGTSTETFTLASWPPENPPFVVPQGGRVTKPVNKQIAQQQCRAVIGKNQNADCVFDVMVTGNPGFARTYLLEQKIQGGLTSTVVRDDKATAKPNGPVVFTATVVRSAVVTGVVQRSVDRKSKPRGQVIPTGTVQFTLAGKNVGKPVRLDAKGQARVKLSRRQLGTRQLAARYLPARGSVFLASRSLEEPRQVTKHKD